MSCRMLEIRDGTAFERLWHGNRGRVAAGWERCALILTSDEHAGENLPLVVEQCGLEPLCLGSVAELRTAALDETVTLLLCEEVVPDGDFQDALGILAAAAKKIPVIVFSRIADWESYLRAVRLGAYDFIRYPFRRGELQRILGQIICASQRKV